MNARRAGWLFAVVAAVQLLPVWSVRYIPTSDGAAHLYNSLVIHDLIAGRRGAITDVYAIDPRPQPNWIGHAFMAAAMFIVPPLVAEKLLFSATILLFLAAMWALASRMSSPVYAFLALPLTYHWMLQTGFYNFSVAVGISIVTIAVWWRRRDEPTLKTIAIVATLLVLCYFSHPLPLCIAIAVIGMIWLAMLRERRLAVHIRHLAAVVPVVPLMVWFAFQQGAHTGAREKPIPILLRDLAEGRILLTFDREQLILGTFVFLTIAALIVATAVIEGRERRAQNAVVPAALLLFGLYLWSPSSVANGLGFAERVVLFIYLLPIAWLSPRLPSGLRAAIAWVFGIVAVANAIYLVARFRHYEPPIRAIVERVKAAQPETRILPLIFDRMGGNPTIPLLWHSVAYGATEKRLIDLDNYEPRTGYFPTRFREGVVMPDFSIVEYAPDQLDIAGAAPQARYIVTWRQPPEAWTAGNLERLYRLVDASGNARLYERRSAFGVETSQLEQVLLPIAGTAREVGAMYGVRWRIDQSVTNSGHAAVHVALSHCSEMATCDFDVEPGQTVPIFAEDPIRPFVYAYVPHGWERSIAFSTLAHRTDRWFPEADVKVPAVPAREFGSKGVTIPNVFFSPDTRLNLRLYTLGVTPPRAIVRVSSPSGQPLGEVSLPVYATNYFTDGDLEKRFATVKGLANVTVETDGKLWAFIAATDPQGRSTVHLPK